MHNLKGLGGDKTQFDPSPAICSSINPVCIYRQADTHTDRNTGVHIHRHTHTHSAVCGDKDEAISECEEGVGLVVVGWEVPFCETRVGFEHALWAAAYRSTAGRVHRTAFPLKTEVKVKVSAGRGLRWKTPINARHQKILFASLSRVRKDRVCHTWKPNELIGIKEISNIGSISVCFKVLN